MKERAIDYPVALDNGYDVWSAFDNHYWPALYFVDADGVIRDHHSAKDATSSQSASSSSCSASTASSSPSKGSGWRRKPTGTTSGPPRRLSATREARSSRHRTAPRSTNAAPTSFPSACASTTGLSRANG